MGRALLQRAVNLENTKYKKRNRLTSINVLLRGQSNMIFLVDRELAPKTMLLKPDAV